MHTPSPSINARCWVHHHILSELEASRPIPLELEALHIGLSLGGSVLRRTTLLKELATLQAEGLLKAKPSDKSPGSYHYRILAAGKAYLKLTQNL